MRRMLVSLCILCSSQIQTLATNILNVGTIMLNYGNVRIVCFSTWLIMDAILLSMFIVKKDHAPRMYPQQTLPLQPHFPRQLQMYQQLQPHVLTKTTIVPMEMVFLLMKNDVNTIGNAGLEKQNSFIVKQTFSLISSTWGAIFQN